MDNQFYSSFHPTSTRVEQDVLFAFDNEEVIEHNRLSHGDDDDSHFLIWLLLLFFGGVGAIKIFENRRPSHPSLPPSVPADNDPVVPGLPSLPDPVKPNPLDLLGQTDSMASNATVNLFDSVRTSMNITGMHGLDSLLNLSILPLFTGVLIKCIKLINDGIIQTEQDARLYLFMLYYHRCRFDGTSGFSYPRGSFIGNSAGFFSSSNNASEAGFQYDETIRHPATLYDTPTQANAFWSREIIPFPMDVSNPRYLNPGPNIYDVFRRNGLDEAVYQYYFERFGTNPYAGNDIKKVLFSLKDKQGNWLSPGANNLQSIIYSDISDWQLVRLGYRMNVFNSPEFLDSINSLSQLNAASASLFSKESAGAMSLGDYAGTYSRNNLEDRLANSSVIIPGPTSALRSLATLFSKEPNISKITLLRSGDGSFLGHKIHLPSANNNKDPFSVSKNDGETNIAQLFTKVADAIVRRIISDQSTDDMSSHMIAYRNRPHVPFALSEWVYPLFTAVTKSHSYYQGAGMPPPRPIP